jgi:hypothetical protein
MLFFVEEGVKKYFRHKKGSQKNSETLVYFMEAASRFELENNGFAGRRLTTWPSRLYHSKYSIGFFTLLRADNN